MESLNVENKKCPRCGITKTLNDFTIRKSGRVGHAVAHCKTCRVEIYKESRKQDKSIYRRIEWPSKLKRLYGMTVNDYEAMLKNQGNGCAICNSKIPKSRKYHHISDAKFCVDHDHRTGKIRGLLCTPCNRAIGLLKDNVELAIRVAEYLKKGELQ